MTYYVVVLFEDGQLDARYLSWEQDTGIDAGQASLKNVSFGA